MRRLPCSEFSHTGTELLARGLTQATQTDGSFPTDFPFVVFKIELSEAYLTQVLLASRLIRSLRLLL